MCIRDEFNQTGYGVGVNSKLTELYGVEETGPVLTGSRGANNSIALAKMDIPWAEQLDTVIVTDESCWACCTLPGATPRGPSTGGPTTMILYLSTQYLTLFDCWLCSY